VLPSVRINEVLTLPSLIDWNGDGQITNGDAWIELYNAGDAAVDLSGWRIELIDEEEAVYRIPKETILKPKQHLVLYPNQTRMDAVGSIEMRLLNKPRQLIDVVTVPVLPADASYSLDNLGIWHADWPPTPGESNSPLAPETHPVPRQIPAQPF
jgi:hypothetical protein